MKTKIFGGIAILAIAVAGAFNVTLSNQKQDAASMLALANVEALAQSEGTTTCSASSKCFANGVEYGSISCTGKTSCISGYEWVSCDGNKSTCAN